MGVLMYQLLTCCLIAVRAPNERHLAAPISGLPRPGTVRGVRR
jgi:hypothetical protein